MPQAHGSGIKLHNMAQQKKDGSFLQPHEEISQKQESTRIKKVIQNENVEQGLCV